MKLKIYKDTEKIDWNILCELYQLAPLGRKSIDELQTTYGNSRYKCFIYKENQLIGAGRALADGVDCSYLCDIAVHPDYQGCGIGKKLVQNLMDLSKGHKKIILYANPGKETFYEKLGFKKMNTAMAIFKNEDEMIENGTIAEF